MKIVIMLLIGMIFVLSLFIYKLLRELKMIHQQAIIKANTDSNFIITSDLDMKTYHDLCESLNGFYEKYHHEKIDSIKREKEFKEMLSYIAHDVRTPLTSVQGYLQILKEKDVDKEDVAYYTIIDQRIHDIRNLLEQFFIYAKLLNHDYKMEVEKCNLYQVCCDALAGFYQPFINRKIEPVLVFKQPEMMVNGNGDLLRRVFDNLINNALIHGNGNLTITQEGKVLCFSNSFIEEIKIDQDQVFERFYKADRSRTNISSGLGLAIVKEIVKVFGWCVDVKVEHHTFQIIITMEDCVSLSEGLLD